ncbi:MAG: metallophosphoesterase [Planctomycetota bacterium]
MELAHVSDLHFRWDAGQAGVPARGFLNKRVLGWLNITLNRSHPRAIADALGEDLRARPPEQLAITGDLTNLSLPGELEAARRWIEGLGLPPARISLIPGNHDTYVRGSMGSFERAYAAWLDRDPAASEAADADPAARGWPRAQRRGDLLLVSTTSCVPTPAFQAWGEMGAAQLDALARLLEGSDAPTKAVLVHHPPLLAGGRPEHARRGNRDAEGLLERCQGAADLILCGHTHRAFRHTVAGERPLHVVCAGSTTAAPRRLGEGATYNRYRIEGGQVLGYEVRGYDPERGRFEHVREERLAPAEAVEPA